MRLPEDMGCEAGGLDFPWLHVGVSMVLFVAGARDEFDLGRFQLRFGSRESRLPGRGRAELPALAQFLGVGYGLPACRGRRLLDSLDRCKFRLFILGLPYFTFLGIMYCLVPAVICLAIACASGAALYGLLSVMRRAGKGGLKAEDLKPRPLRLVA